MESDLYPAMPLAEVMQIHDSLRVPIKKSERKPGIYPYYGASGIVDWVESFLFDGIYILLAEDGENLRSKNTPIAFLAEGQFWVNNHAHVLKGDDDLDTKFFCYALQVANVDSHISGSTRPKLTQGDMKRIRLWTPPKKERHKIAAILGSLDDKIKANRKVAETLEAIASAIFKSWFVDFDPVRAKIAGATSWPSMPQAAFDALPTAFVETEIGEVPEGWDVKSIEEVVTIKGGATPRTNNPEYWENGTFCWATPKDLSGLNFPVLMDTARHITESGVEVISSRQLPKDTVLMSSRAPVGYLAVAQVPTAINQGFIAMICEGPLPPMFVLQWASHSMDLIRKNAGGTTFSEISKRNFRPLPITVPSPKLVTAYRKIAEPLFVLLVAQIKANQTLAKTRDTLLPKLISGELRVEEAQEEMEAFA